MNDEGKSLSYREYFDKLLRFCDYQERCESEVIKKAKTLGLEDSKTISELLSELIELGVLDNKRYAQSFTRGKFKLKKWGKKRIERELKFKGISPEFIREAISNMDIDDYNNQIRELAEYKLEQINKGSDYEKKGKIFRFLYSKGYESDRINEVIRELF